MPPKQEPIDPDMIRQHPDTAAASTTATLNDDLGSPLDDVGALVTTIEKIMCTTYFTPAFVIVFEKKQTNCNDVKNLAHILICFGLT